MVDVGRLAGVSAQTVSRYFTGKGYVGAATQAKIEAAIVELGYTFNQAARSLRVNSTQTIGVLATGPSVYGTWTIMAGLNEAARQTEFGLVTSQVEADPRDSATSHEIHRALERLLVARVDGVIVASPFPGIEDFIERVWETVPVVILSGLSWPHADSAAVDSYQAGVLATQHLLDLGHTQIQHIAGPASSIEGQQRAAAYLDTLAAAGVEPLPVVRGDWSSESGAAAAEQVEAGSFTAVFSGNDQMALGFMSAFRRRGLAAPRDFSIVGVDDMPDARYFAPPLTSVWMDFKELGRAGFMMLIERIRTGERVSRRIIQPTLAVRESTARIVARGTN